MVEYGIFKQSLEVVETASGTSVTVIFMRNEHGQDMVDVARENPSAWYIAVSTDNRIISMEDDIEHSQIADVRIIGINSDFGYTRGEGGSVYGKYWNGSAIVDGPELTDIEKREQAPKLSRVDFRLRMKQAGITSSIINSAIAAITDADLRDDYEIIWGDEQRFGRLDPFVIAVFEHAGKSPAQADAIWND